MSFILSLAKTIVKVYFSLFLIFHALIYFVPESVNYMVFQNIVKWPFTNFKNPTDYNIGKVHNFYIDVEANKIGVWHLIPNNLEYNHEKHSTRSNEQHFQAFLQSFKLNPVIIYVHGNDGDRATPYRLELYKNLLNLGYHVFAIDYRGYGDSTGHPTEEGVVNDVLGLYELILTYQPDTKVFLYGHSLGTAIVCHTAKVISEKKNVKLSGVILEAPFVNVSQETKDYHISKAFVNNDWIKAKIDEALEKVNIHFNSDQHILKIKPKILIMHAEDDWYIPQWHSRELYNIAEKYRPKEYGKVKFVELGKHFGLGHFIQSHSPIYPIIKDFVESV